MVTDLEKEPDDKDLQPAHADDQGNLDHAEAHDAPLGAGDGTEVAVLARAEVLLAARYGGELARDLEDRLLENGRLLGGGALLGG